MAKRRPRRSRLQKMGADVLSMVTSAREASRTALQQLHKEISAAKGMLEKLVGAERSFRLDLFGTGGAGRPRGASKARKRGRPAGRRQSLAARSLTARAHQRPTGFSQSYPPSSGLRTSGR